MKTVVKKVFVLDGGALELDASVMVSLQNPGQRIRIPVTYFLLETSRGYVLVDTGNDPDVITDPAGTWGVPLAEAATPIMEPINHPLEQLKLLGLNANDVKMVVYTHLHHDHCGGARFFPDAVHVVQKAEYRWVYAPDRFATFPYVKSDYNHPNFNWQLAEGDWSILPGVQLISTPGHTPGHQSVALWDVPDVGSVILAGDAANCRDNFAMDTPGGITSDATAAVSSLHRLTALATSHDANLLVGHDMGFFEMLPKAPNPLTRLSDEARAFCNQGVHTVYSHLKDPNNLI
jgi:N-acyl homoserine lactone hydrolase